MQNNKKRQEYAISIRRKQISQKIQALRSQLHTQTQTNYEQFMPILNQIHKDQKLVQHCLKQLKILSFPSQSAALIFKTSIHHKLYAYLVEKDKQILAPQYNDIITILINLCVHVELDITSKAIQIVTLSILKPERQIISLWLISNIIYQKSSFSGLLSKELIQKCDVLEYMENRHKKKFQNEGDIVIFNFFCCAFLVVSSNFSSSSVKRIFQVIQSTLNYEPKSQQNFWFLSEALVDHGPYIGASQYQIFGRQIMKKFEVFCKNKKTKYVKNYLKMLIGFTKYDKLAYQKFLKYAIFSHLDFCLENRFPEVKKLCAEIGHNLLQNFGNKVDIQNIGFFEQMVLQVLNLEKYPANIQIQIIRYCYKFFALSASNQITKQAKQKFITQLLTSNTLTVICVCLLNSQGNIQLITEILNLLQLFIKIDESKNKRVIHRCKNEKITDYLESIINGNNGIMSNQTILSSIEKFLEYFH